MLRAYLKYFVGSIPLSFFVFLAILYPLVSLKNSVDTQKELNSSIKQEVNITLPSDEELYEKSFQKFQDKCGTLEINCEELIAKDINETKAKLLNPMVESKNDSTKEVTFIGYVFDTNYMIIFIYVLLILAVNFPISTALYIKFEEINNLDEVFFDITDWAINTPPILGVLGTIIAFALLVAQSGNIQESFSRAFFDAALTTIAGGLIYTLNLALKIYIFKHMSSNT